MDSNNKNKELGQKNMEQVDETRKEILNQEQPEVDSVEISHDPKAPDSNLNPNIMKQYDQAKEPSQETLKLRNYKKRQMQEFTNDYSIGQVLPSAWGTVISVVNTILLTLALVVAFLVAFGLVFGLRIGIVPTDSMEPEISVGSLVIVKPLESIDEIRVGDNLSYVKGDKKYIHKVESVGGGAIVMVGANPMYDQKDIIDFSAVEGRQLLAIPGMGYFVLGIQQNIILVIAVFLVVIVALQLLRMIIERRHNDDEIADFLEKKTAYEKNAEEKLKAQKKAEAQQKFDEIMRDTHYTAPQKDKKG